jgi:L-alanine-DL-glutamate epimerase-like enolase superfamily enzyme
MHAAQLALSKWLSDKRSGHGTAHHIQVPPHSGSVGPVAEYAALHVLAAIPNALILEQIADDCDDRNRTIAPQPAADRRPDCGS